MVIDCRCSRPVGCKQKSGNCNCAALSVLLNGQGAAAGEGEPGALLGGCCSRRQPCHPSVTLPGGLIGAKKALRVIFTSAAPSPPVYTSTCVHICWWLYLSTQPLAKEKARCLPWPKPCLFLRAFLGFRGMYLGINYGTECRVKKKKSGAIAV